MSADPTTPEAVEPEASKLSLNIKVDEPSACERHVTVTISREDIERYREDAVKELLPTAEIPGFRIGKAPRKLVENKFREQVENQIKGSLLMDSMTQVTEEHDFSAISEPNFDYDSVVIPGDGDMTFEFDLEVRPNFDLPVWEGLKLERPVREYAAEDIDAQIDKIRARSGELLPSDDAATAGDYVIVNITCRQDGKELTKLEEQSLEVRPKLSFRDASLDNFGELMEGCKADDKKEAKVKISDEAENEALRGSEIDVEIEVLEVKKLELPKLNHQYLEKLGGFNDVEELRGVVREELERQFVYHQNQKIREQITAELTKEANWELPPDLLRRQARRELERAVMELQAAGFPDSEIQHHANQIRQNSMASTARALKEHFILERLAEEHEIDATPEDYEAEVMMIAMQRHESPRRVRARMEKRGQMDALRNQIIERRVIEMIKEKAEFAEVDFVPQAQDAAAVDHAVSGSRDADLIPDVTPESSAKPEE